MYALAVILARAGSKGLPDKCVRSLLGHPVIDYTFDHALAAELIDGIVFTTDSAPAAAFARNRGIEVIDRPPELANDTARVDAVARHAVARVETERRIRCDVIALLYGNIPVRAPGIIDRAVRHLRDTGATSVRTVAPVGRHHPDWLHRLDGDRMQQFRNNGIYRRQDLEPMYYHDGAVAVVTRDALFSKPASGDDGQAFLGTDRRAVVQNPDDAVDIDGPADLLQAEAILRARRWATATVDHHESGRTPAMPAVNRPRHLRVGDRDVGHGCRVFIIAEAGVNHGGSIDRALAMVDAAADAGADAVKFQAFCADRLTTAAARTAAYQAHATGKTSQRDMLARLELSADQFRRIAERCRQRGVMFLATPFSATDLDGLLELEIRAVKIASTDLVDLELLARAARTGLPLIISTGASDEGEIARAMDVIRAGGAAERVILLHCVSCYPTPTEHANLAAIGTLRTRFAIPVGYSDHTTLLESGAWAVCAGACLLEKHFTLDRTADGPDHAMSLTADELSDYIRRAREAQAAMGGGALAVQAIEREVRSLSRKSVVATRTIERGERIEAAALTAKRADEGVSAADIATIVGATAVMTIPADAPVTPEMFR